MTVAVSQASLDRFRHAIALHLGLHFHESRLAQLDEVLRRRIKAGGETVAAYLDRLDKERSRPDELRMLAQELTVGETYFFRDTDQLNAVAHGALPDRFSKRTASKTLNLLSAGCASGEEAYSLAILVREHFPHLADWGISILGVDINSAMLEKANSGRYASWSFRQTSPDIQQRWFRADGREFLLDHAIRSAVRFDERNLAKEDPDLWQPGKYDIIFCRNVVMYLTPEAARALIARITQALVPGGYLFLGNAETLRGLSQDFHLCHTHGTFYYQSKGPAERIAVMSVAMPSLRPPSADPLHAMVNTSWIEAVDGAAKRIRRLSERSSEIRDPCTIIAAKQSPPDLSFAVEFLKKERYAEALALLGDLSYEARRDPDALLLRAVLQTHSGHLDDAQRTCAELLELDELNAGAHYLLALCLESLGDPKGAAEHDQVAVYLDSTFAMPRLHLGLLARRGGDRAAARSRLAQALELLQNEDSSRLLLFGAGFGREALIRLCCAELVAAGGKP